MPAESLLCRSVLRPPFDIRDDFRFRIGKALDDNGYGSMSTVLEAVQNCVNNGAKVISLSLGGLEFSQTNMDAYQAHYDAGVLIIAAAGTYF